MIRGSFLALFGAAFITLMACGPESGGAKTPAAGKTASSPSSGSAGSVPPPAESGSTPTPVAQVPTSQPTAPPGLRVEMKPVTPTAMELQLREIGLDPTALPPLKKLDPKMLRDVMNTFNKALGVKCSHCHEKDYKAPTQNKKIATHMWDDFTRALVREPGPLYCDSCHKGQPKFLDRQNLAALGDYMQENYVEHVSRADKKEHSCETSHGEPFEGHILTRLWR